MRRFSLARFVRERDDCRLALGSRMRERAARYPGRRSSVLMLNTPRRLVF